jgi:triacylglycerol esterase/lipase EstA (alpha/beta hydrolase family)
MQVLAVKTEVWGEKAKRVKLSLIGHSLGGLIIRYAIGHLLEKNLLATHFDPQVRDAASGS